MYQAVRTSGRLARSVSGLWYFDGPSPDVAAVPVLPKASGFLTICFDGAPSLAWGDGLTEHSASVSINGLVERRPVALEFPSRMRVIGVDLTPVGLRLLSGSDATSFTNRAVDATDVLGEPMVSRIVDRAQEASPSDALAIVQSELDDVVNAATNDDCVRRVGAVVAAIAAERGRPPIARLAADAAISPRTLQRVFPRVVGVDVRTYVGRVAFTRFAAGHAARRWSSLEQCAFDLGFHDASHLRRFVAGHTGRSTSDVVAAIGERRHQHEARLLNYRHAS